MAKSKQERYETTRESIEERYDSIDETDQQLIFEFLDANDPDKHQHDWKGESTKSYGTLARYARVFSQICRDMDVSLSEASAEDINDLMQSYLNGDAETTKDEGISKASVRKRQGPMRKFYRYYDDLGVDPEDIYINKSDSSTSVDPRDIFDSGDIQNIREAAKNRGTRDAALVDLLLYTGQRISAILGLRVKDVEPDEGVLYLNEEAGDLKGASGKRPLLGAQKSARDWKRQHPTGERDDFFITHKTDQQYRKENDDLDTVEPGDKLDNSTVYYLLQNIGDEAGVDKPCNAHAFRHAFVTMAIRDYDMSVETVRHLIGHKPGSTVLEEIYAHLTDEDYIDDAEESFGIKEPEDESPLTPNVCDRCSEPLEGEWEACPYCGMNYSPASQQTKDEIEDSMWNEKSEAEAGSKTDESVDQLRNLLRENPELMEKLVSETE